MPVSVCVDINSQTRKIEHIHVKVKPEGGAEVTSQLYFPQRPMDGLTVMIEERGDYLIGYFNFVVQKQGRGVREKRAKIL